MLTKKTIFDSVFFLVYALCFSSLSFAYNTREIESNIEYSQADFRLQQENIKVQKWAKEIPSEKETEFAITVLADACMRSPSKKICQDSLMTLAKAIDNNKNCFRLAANIAGDLGKQKRFLEKKLSRYEQPL